MIEFLIFLSDSDSVYYRIDETVYRYGDRVKQANGFISIDEKSGIVRLAQSPYDSVGGVFESHISSSDLSDIVSHIATTKLKVYSKHSFSLSQLHSRLSEMFIDMINV